MYALDPKWYFSDMGYKTIVRKEIKMTKAEKTGHLAHENELTWGFGEIPWVLQREAELIECVVLGLCMTVTDY